MKTPNPRYLVSILALALGFVVLGNGCKQDSVSIEASPTPKVAAPTTTPEQAWDMYVKGWKNENLDEILASCAPNKEAQDYCRKLFNGIRESGNIKKAINAFETGKLILDDTDPGNELRHYRLEFEDKTGLFVFQYVEGLGWRIAE